MGKERFLVDVKVDRSVEFSDREMLEIRLLERDIGKKQEHSAGFQDFVLFRDLLGIVLQDQGLGREGDQEGCFIVKSLLV